MGKIPEETDVREGFKKRQSEKGNEKGKWRVNKREFVSTSGKTRGDDEQTANGAVGVHEKRVKDGSFREGERRKGFEWEMEGNKRSGFRK